MLKENPPCEVGRVWLPQFSAAAGRHIASTVPCRCLLTAIAPLGRGTGGLTLLACFAALPAGGGAGPVPGALQRFPMRCVLAPGLANPPGLPPRALHSNVFCLPLKGNVHRPQRAAASENRVPECTAALAEPWSATLVRPTGPGERTGTQNASAHRIPGRALIPAPGRWNVLSLRASLAYPRHQHPLPTAICGFVLLRPICSSGRPKTWIRAQSYPAPCLFRRCSASGAPPCDCSPSAYLATARSRRARQSAGGGSAPPTAVKATPGSRGAVYDSLRSRHDAATSHIHGVKNE